jgi:hypothetical protein
LGRSKLEASLPLLKKIALKYQLGREQKIRYPIHQQVP